MPKDNNNTMVGRDMKQEPVPGTVGPGKNKNKRKIPPKKDAFNIKACRRLAAGLLAAAVSPSAAEQAALDKERAAFDKEFSRRMQMGLLVAAVSSSAKERAAFDKEVRRNVKAGLLFAAASSLTAERAAFDRKSCRRLTAGLLAVASLAAIGVAHMVTADKSNIQRSTPEKPKVYQLSGFDKGAHLLGQEEAAPAAPQLVVDDNGLVQLTPEEEIDQILGVAQITQDQDGDYCIEYDKDVKVTITTDSADNSQSVTVENPSSDNIVQFEVENGEVTSSHNLGAIGANFLMDGVGKVGEIVDLVKEYDNDDGSADGLSGDYNDEIRDKLSSFAYQITRAGGKDLEGITADGVDIEYSHYGDESKGPGDPNTGLAVCDMHIELEDEQVAGGTNSFSMEYNHDMENAPGIQQITVTNSFTDSNGETTTNKFMVVDGKIPVAEENGKIGLNYDDVTENVIVMNAENVIDALKDGNGVNITESLDVLRDFTKTGEQQKAELKIKTADIGPAIESPELLAAAEAAAKTKGVDMPGEYIVASSSGLTAVVDTVDQTVAKVQDSFDIVVSSRAQERTT